MRFAHVILPTNVLQLNTQSILCSMQFSKFVTELLAANSPTSYPELIYAPAESRPGLFFGGSNIFWEKIKELRKYTDSTADKFSKEHVGSTGWEYEMMMAEFDGKFFYSAPSTSRDYTQVTSKHSLGVKPALDNATMTLTEEVTIDDKVVSKTKITGRDKVEKRIKEVWSGEASTHKTRPQFVCHFHSHPQVQVSGSEKRIYTFFSSQDLSSLLYGSTPIMGLVTDRLWLLMKPKNSGLSPTPADLQEVTRTEAQDPANLEAKAAEVMNKYGFALYVAPFGGTFKRLTKA